MYNKKVLIDSLKKLGSAKAPTQKKDMIIDPMGQWAHPGENTRIPSNRITMKGVNYPVLGIANTGQKQMMQPGQEYNFPGADYVDEYPQMRSGGLPNKKNSKKYSRSLDATNRLFAEHPWFKKPKSRKNKIYDPNAKYYQGGGTIWVENEDDPRYKDYLIRQGLYNYSNNPNFNLRSWGALDLSSAIQNNDFSDFNNTYYDTLLSNLNKNKPSGDLSDDDRDFYESLIDQNVGPYGSNVNYQTLGNDQLHTDRDYNDAYFWLKDLEQSNDFFKNYPPINWQKKQSYIGEPYGFNYQYLGPTANHTNWTKPSTLLIEDKINRNELKKVYPNLTDAQIDKWIEKRRKEPPFLTNIIAPGGYSTYADTYNNNHQYIANPNKKTFIDADGNIGYLPEEIIDMPRRDYDYIPTWGKPETVVKVLPPPIKIGPPPTLEHGELPELQPGNYFSEPLPEAPQYTLYPYTDKRLRLVKTPGKTKWKTHRTRLGDGQKYKWTTGHSTKDLEFRRKEVTKPIAALVQKLTGYDPKYFEGYYDEEDNYTPGELDYGNLTGAKLEFKGAASLRDFINQQKYKKEYEEYQKKLDEWDERYEQSKKKQAEGSAFKKGGSLPKAQDGPPEEFYKNWYQNRVMPTPEGQKLLDKIRPEALERSRQMIPYIYSDKLKPDDAGYYDTKTQEIILNKFLPEAQIEATKQHEFGHHIQAGDKFYNVLDKPHQFLVEQNIIEPEKISTGNSEWDEKLKENYDYVTQPDEMHARIMTLRRLAGFQPNQVITEKDLKDYFNKVKEAGEVLDPDIEDLRGVTKGNQSIVNLLNDMVSVPSNREDLNVAQDGGEPQYNNLPPTYLSALQNFVYPNIEENPERTGYNSVNNTISYDSQSPIENMNNDWWREHELFHDLQNQAGGMSTSGVVGQRPNSYVASDESIQGYYDRRDADVNRTIDSMIAQNPELQFIPRNKLTEGSGPGFIGAEDLQYSDPSTLEGEARQYEQYIREGNPSIFPKKKDGGENKTKLNKEEEKQFQKFYKTLPENLQTDDDTYDIRGYWDALGRPEEFDYTQPKEKDGYYHAFSINPNTGEYLKSPAHETFQHAVDEDRKIGYRPIPNVYGRNIATYNQSISTPEQQSFLRNIEGPANYIETELTPEEIEQYAKGGYIVEDISVPSLTKAQGGLQVKNLINTAKNFARITNIGTLGTLNTLAKNFAPVMINPARLAVLGSSIDKVGPFTGSPLNAVPFYGVKMESTPGTAFRKFGDTLDYVKTFQELNPAHGPLLRMGKNQIMSEGNWAELNEPNEQYSGVFGAQFDTRIPNSDLSFKKIPKRNGVLVTDASGNLKPIIPLSEPGLSFHRRLPFSNRYIPVDMDKLRNNQFDWRTIGGNAQSLLERYGYAAGYAGILGAMGLGTPQKYLDEYINEPIMKGYNKYIKPSIEALSDSSLKKMKKGGQSCPPNCGQRQLTSLAKTIPSIFELPKISTISIDEFKNLDQWDLQNREINYPFTITGPSGELELIPYDASKIHQNVWSLYANMPNQIEAGKAFYMLNQMMKPRPTIVQTDSLSVDSLTNMLNMGNRKDWDAEYIGDLNFNTMGVNSQIFKGLSMPRFAPYGFQDDISNQVVERLNELIQNKGYNEEAYLQTVYGSPFKQIFVPNYKLQRKWKKGGESNYELGDEVDEATMKELKKLGFTFEKL